MSASGERCSLAVRCDFRHAWHTHPSPECLFLSESSPPRAPADLYTPCAPYIPRSLPTCTSTPWRRSHSHPILCKFYVGDRLVISERTSAADGGAPMRAVPLSRPLGCEGEVKVGHDPCRHMRDTLPCCALPCCAVLSHATVRYASALSVLYAVKTYFSPGLDLALR